MKYFTREYYGKSSIKSIIPNCMTVIADEEYDFQSLLQKRIAEHANVEKIITIALQKRPEGGYVYGTHIAMQGYEYHLQLLKEYLDKDIQEKIRDIRVLALRFITQEEYTLLKDWAEEFEAKAAQAAADYGSCFKKIENRLPSSVKQFLELDFYDLKCKEVLQTQRTITIIYGDSEQKLRIDFLGAENVHCEGSPNYLLAREVYLNDNGTCSIHVLFKEGDITLDCVDIEITDQRVWYAPDDKDAPVAPITKENQPRPNITRILDDV